jgi:hypothetical protein
MVCCYFLIDLQQQVQSIDLGGKKENHEPSVKTKQI